MNHPDIENDTVENILTKMVETVASFQGTVDTLTGVSEDTSVSWIADHLYDEMKDFENDFHDLIMMLYDECEEED